MKKRIMTMIAGVCAAAMLGGCAGSKNITVKKYEGLEVEKAEEMAVTDEEIESSIQSDLETLATTSEVTDRAAKLGDISVIDFVGKKDGVAFEGGTGEDYELELGSHSFIDGFEDGIVGHNIGETFDLDLKFPEGYQSEELAGQAVVFTVTLKGLQEKRVPELTDEILPQLGTSAKTVEEYKAEVKKQIEENNAETQKYTLRSNALAALLKQCEVEKYPEGLIDKYTKILVDYNLSMAAQSGLDLDEKTMYEQYPDIEAQIKEAANSMATQELAVDYIAEKEGLTLTDKQYKTGAEKMATQYGFDGIDEFVEQYEQVYGEGSVRRTLLEEKVADFLLESCVLVEPKETE